MLPLAPDFVQDLVTLHTIQIKIVLKKLNRASFDYHNLILAAQIIHIKNKNFLYYYIFDFYINKIYQILS